MNDTPCTYRISVKAIILEHGEDAQEAKYFSRGEAKELQLHDNTKPYFS
jgi:hypothetical protein